jgi:hypothetical protein
VIVVTKRRIVGSPPNQLKNLKNPPFRIPAADPGGARGRELLA